MVAAKTMVILAFPLASAIQAPPAAQPRVEFALHYAAPPECSEQPELLALLEHDLGARAVVVDGAAIAVHAIIVAVPRNGYRLTFEVIDRGGSTGVSELRDGACASLVRAVALRTSLVLANVLASAPERSPEVAATSAAVRSACPTLPTRSCPASAPLPAGPAQRSNSSTRFRVRLAGGGEFFGAGLHGTVAATGMVRVAEVHAAVVQLEMRGSHAVPTRYALAHDRRAGVRVHLGWITPAVCLRSELGKLAIPLCVGVEFGVMVARGFGIRRPETSRTSWVAIPVRTGSVVGLTRHIGLFVEFEAAPLVIRPGARVVGLPLVYRVGPISARVWAGVEIRLGSM
jgi:hypothetical protein